MYPTCVHTSFTPRRVSIMRSSTSTGDVQATPRCTGSYTDSTLLAVASRKRQRFVMIKQATVHNEQTGNGSWRASLNATGNGNDRRT